MLFGHLWPLTIICTWAAITSGFPLSSFYPFGQSVNDLPMSKSDDNYSAPILLPSSVKFFGSFYQSLQVHTNGYLFFKDNSGLSYSPAPLPINGSAFVAPYWADIDTRGTGNVSYRITRDPELLQRARNDSSSRASPLWLFIATWNHVGYYDQQTDKTNTFQCVLFTNGAQSHVLFLYADGLIQWTVAKHSQKQDMNALAGVNAGDGVNYAIVPESLNTQIINVSSTTNVRVGGIWLFRIDTAGCITYFGPEDWSAPNITVQPGNVSTSLDSNVTLLCQVTGCGSSITWYKDNKVVSTGQYLLIPAIKPSNRGLYTCRAVNTQGYVSWSEASITIQGVHQYSAQLKLNTTVASDTATKLHTFLEGQSVLNKTASIVFANISYQGATVDVLITLAMNSSSTYAYNVVIRDLNDLLLLAFQTVQISAAALQIQRFDGCPPLLTADTNTLQWPESEIGTTRTLSSCIQRRCGGSYSSGAQWEPIVITCSSFTPNDFSTAVSILESLLSDSLSNPEVANVLLQNVDKLLQIDPNTIYESNVGARLLNILNFYSNNAIINHTTVFASRTFAIQLEDVDVINGVQCFSGKNFSVDLDSVDLALAGNRSIDKGSIRSSSTENTTASVFVTSQCSNTGSSNGTSQYRLTFYTFIQNTLFQSQVQDKNGFKLGSIIISVGGNATALADSLLLSFQVTKAAEKASNISAVQWIANSVDGSNMYPGGVWSTEGIRTTRKANNTVTAVVQLWNKVRSNKVFQGNFGILLDLNPGGVDCPAADILSAIGVIISLITLLLFLVTYLSSSRLRTSEHGLVLINMGIALLCLYAVFMLASYSTPVPALCGTGAAFVHYFMLVYFMWTGVEAVILFIKLVIVFSSDIRHLALKLGLVAWLVPFLVVIISVGAGHNYYINQNYCRPSWLPFYVGLILPFLAIYVFNWTMFSIIMVSLCRHWAKLRQARQQGMAARDPPPPATKTGSDFTLRHVVNSAGLALILGLGWGFGLAASSNDISALACTLQFLFSVFVSCQGVLILLFHGVRSKDVRTVWASWLHWLSDKLGFSCCRQSTGVLVLKSSEVINTTTINV